MITGLLALLLTGCAVSPGIEYQMGKTQFAEQNYREAFTHLQKAAQMRNANAQYALGYLYYYGLGVDQNTEEAYYWFKAAADQGDYKAMMILPKIAAQMPGPSFLDEAQSTHPPQAKHHSPALSLPKPKA